MGRGEALAEQVPYGGSTPPRPFGGSTMQKEFRFVLKASHVCRRCGRALHDKKSIGRGMGMTCYLKSCKQGLLFLEGEGRKHG